jgi:hypothetical protein
MSPHEAEPQPTRILFILLTPFGERWKKTTRGEPFD